jgi:spermidine/putrescine transport system ATP-binding protein
VRRFFGDVEAVKNVNLEINKGEFFSLLGPSGCGKTTTLRLIGGFEQPSSGEIFICGEKVNGKPPYKRLVNTVFQNYALFPHMNVYDNVAFGLVQKNVPKETIRQKVSDILELVRLTGFEKRRIQQMSGGQQQRVALARALVNEPEVLLLDEPLGALDQKLRKSMQVELKQLQEKLGITFILVTHDQEEALSMSDRIAVMNEGRLEQVGKPYEIYEHPKTRFVADFIGVSNFLKVCVKDITSDIINLNLEGLHLKARKNGVPCKAGDELEVSIRPERLWLSRKPDQRAENVLKGAIADVRFLGDVFHYDVRLNENVHILVSQQNLVFQEHESDFSPLAEGDDIFLHCRPDSLKLVKT